MLAAPGAFACVQRGEHADGAEHAAAKIADGNAGPRRRRAFLPGDRHAAAIALRHHVEGRAFERRAGFTEPGYRAGDDALVYFGQLVIVDFEPRRDAGAEVAEHDIGLFHQLVKQRQPFLTLQIDTNAFFIAVERQEISAHAV